MENNVNKSELAIFENENFGQIRSIIQNGEPWFVAKDICEILGLGNPSQACANVDEDEKGIINSDTPGGKQ